MTKEYWRYYTTLKNSAGALADQRLYFLEPKNGISVDLMCGLLNSSAYALLREFFGREEQGAAMNRNTLTVSDAKNLPILDPEKISDNDKDAIVDIVRDIIAKQRAEDEDWMASKKEQLDRAVMRAYGLKDLTEEVRSAAKEAVAAREQRAGQKTQVLVGGEDGDQSLEVDITDIDAIWDD